MNTAGFNPETGKWNDSLTGDFIWGNANIGEALSFVMPPFTWSIVGNAYDQMNILPRYYSVGNIGGRPYQNDTMCRFLTLPSLPAIWASQPSSAVSMPPPASRPATGCGWMVVAALWKF